MNEGERLEEQRLATTALNDALVMSLIVFCLELAEHTGLKEIDGVPVVQWLRRRVKANATEALATREKANPARAARALELLDRELDAYLPDDSQ